MKKYTILFFLSLIAISISAVPAHRKTQKEVILANGKKVMAMLKGDEYAHWWETIDGLILDVDDNDNATILSNYQFENKKNISKQRKVKANATRMARAKAYAPARASYTGSKRALVILVNFKNKAMVSTTAQTDFSEQFNEKGYSQNNHIGSVRDYFYDQSYGQLDINFDVIGPVTVSQNYSYYGQNDSSGNDKYPCTMVSEACKLADEQVDFSKYDWNGDGEVDQIYILYSGYGENSGALSSTIWPHEWTLDDGAVYGDGKGALQLDNTKINTYAVSCELAGKSGNIINGIGTACHEFSHCLGFPDFYDTGSEGTGWGMASWDVMCSGSYSGPNYIGEIPCGYTSYERWVAGWLTPAEVSLGMEIKGQKSLADYPEAYIIYNDNNKNEYYLLENRQADRWFSYIDDFNAPSGMLILHVDYDATEWSNNTPNADPNHQRMTVFQANNNPGTLDDYGYYINQSDYAGHLYPYQANDSLTNTSIPASFVYSKNTDGSLFMNKGIHNISINSDNTIDFSCFNSKDSGDSIATPPVNKDYILYESFDSCGGKGGNDGLWNGFIASALFVSDNNGWDGSAMYGADKCARFGNSEIVGIVHSPSFVLNGDATLTFRAGSWDSNSDGQTVDVYVGTELINVFDIPKGMWTDITVDITGNGATNLTFIPDLRFFLDEVKIASKIVDGIKNISTRNGEETRFYSVTGQFVGTNVKELPNGIYLYKGRKFIKK